MIRRAQTVLLVVVLLAAGVLLGSFLLEWRERTLHTTRAGSIIEGVPGSLVPESEDARVSVEVLNGAGETGAAARITDALRAAGFDVKTFGNAASFDHDRTLVLDAPWPRRWAWTPCARTRDPSSTWTPRSFWDGTGGSACATSGDRHPAPLSSRARRS